MEPIEISDAKAVELFRKYGAGSEENGKVRMHPLEALYFMERGKLSLPGETFDSLLAKIKKEDGLAQEKYAILKHLRQNGYILRPSYAAEDWLRVYRKGFRPGEDRTQYLLRVVGADWKPQLSELAADMKKAAEARKELVYAYVENNRPQFFRSVRTGFD